MEIHSWDGCITQSKLGHGRRGLACWTSARSRVWRLGLRVVGHARGGGRPWVRWSTVRWEWYVRLCASSLSQVVLGCRIVGNGFYNRAVL